MIVEEVHCLWCWDIIRQEYVTKIYCDSECNRRHIYFLERLNNIKAPKAMQPEFSSPAMKDYILYCKEMLVQKEPAIFYNQFAKHLKTKPMPKEIKDYVNNRIPFPKPLDQEPIEIKMQVPRLE